MSKKEVEREAKRLAGLLAHQDLVLGDHVLVTVLRGDMDELRVDIGVANVRGKHRAAPKGTLDFVDIALQAHKAFPAPRKTAPKKKPKKKPKRTASFQKHA